MGFVHMVGRVRPGGKVEFKVDSGINRGAGEALQGWKWATLLASIRGRRLGRGSSLIALRRCSACTRGCRREGSRQSELAALYLPRQIA
jgi:hypothetical protein